MKKGGGGYISGSRGAFSPLAVLRGQAGHENALIFPVSVAVHLQKCIKQVDFARFVHKYVEIKRNQQKYATW